MRAHALIAAAAAALLACTAATSPTKSPAKSPAQTQTRTTATTWSNWWAYHGSGNRSGYARSFPTPTSGLRVVHRIKLDGAVYASPIVWKGTTVIATENDTVYAFSNSFKLLWKRHLGTPSPPSEHPCPGNIDPRGITGTPTYVQSLNSVYVAAELKGPSHRLYSLNLSTGAVRWSRGLDLPGVSAAAMQQRGALLALGTGVYVPFGGIAGDCGNYKGRIVRYAVNGHGSPVSYTVPTSREGGIWTPPGPTSDSKYLYAAVGNGEKTSGRWDGSDSVLKFTQGLTRVDYFVPTNWGSENAGDVDLGSQGPAVVGKWIYQAGKSGRSYVLRRSSLGHIGGQVSSISNPSCHSFGGTAVVGSTVYVPCKEGVRAFTIDSTGHLHQKWHAAPIGSPVVGGGRVWTLDPGAGRLYSLRQSTGSVASSVSVGQTNQFATPALYGHHVIVGTLSGVVVVGFS